MAWWDDLYHRPSQPRKAEGGIRARKWGFGESWWARRWISSLESLGMGPRLKRGARYARAGQVLEVDFEDGGVRARVQGSQREPYVVTIRLAPIEPSVWRKAIAEVRARAGLAARLLAGEMPAELDEALRATGVSLFPARERDLVTDCSCPDWANPCKHIAAVHYLLAEELDRDPMLLLSLRGRTRAELVEAMHEPGEARRRRGAPASAETSVSALVPAAPTAALRPDVRAFWGGGTWPAIPFEPDAAADSDPPLLALLGPFPLWQGDVDLATTLAPAYADAARDARELLGMGGEGSLEEVDGGGGHDGK